MHPPEWRGLLQAILPVTKVKPSSDTARATQWYRWGSLTVRVHMPLLKPAEAGVLLAGQLGCRTQGLEFLLKRWRPGA